MKINAEIEWIADNDAVGVKAGQTETVIVDSDHVTSDKFDVASWIEDELSKKYETHVYASWDEDDDGDFAIVGLDEIVKDIAYEEFRDSTGR